MGKGNAQSWLLKRRERDVRDRGALLYDADGYASPIRRVVERLAVFRHFQTDAGDLVLDVGAGTGRFMEELVKRGCSAVGVDFSRSSLTIAKKRCNCEVVLADLCYMPFRTHSFEKSLSLSVLQHIHPSEHILGLSEIKRVNKKGARILLTIYNYNLWHFLRRQGKDGNHPPGGNYFHRFNFAEARSLLESICFQIESITGVIASDPILRTQMLRTLNLSEKLFTPRFLKAIVAMEKIMERIPPLSFLFGDHLRVICKTPN